MIKTKFKFSLIFYITVISLIASTVLTIYSVRHTENELGMVDKSTFRERVVDNVNELFRALK